MMHKSDLKSPLDMRRHQSSMHTGVQCFRSFPPAFWVWYAVHHIHAYLTMKSGSSQRVPALPKYLHEPPVIRAGAVCFAGSPAPAHDPQCFVSDRRMSRKRQQRPFPFRTHGLSSVERIAAPRRTIERACSLYGWNPHNLSLATIENSVIICSFCTITGLDFLMAPSLIWVAWQS